MEVKESQLSACCTTITSAVVPSLLASSTVSTARADNAVDDCDEQFGAVSVSSSFECSIISASLSLGTASCNSSVTDAISAPVTVASQVPENCHSQLLTMSESSTNLSQCSEEILVNSKSLVDSPKWVDGSFQNSRSMSSPSLKELYDDRHVMNGRATNRGRKRKHGDEIPECGRLMFDKLPNYYTALSIPTRVMAGSTARSSSDLIADFMHDERDPSPVRNSCSQYDKLPAYHSSFTNSTRYDNDDHMSLPAFETDFYQDESEEFEGQYGRSYCENDELCESRLTEQTLLVGSCPEDDHVGEKETSTENVSHFFSFLLNNLSLSLSFRLWIPQVRGQPHGFSFSIQLDSRHPPR